MGKVFDFLQLKETLLDGLIKCNSNVDVSNVVINFNFEILFICMTDHDFDPPLRCVALSFNNRYIHGKTHTHLEHFYS